MRRTVVGVVVIVVLLIAGCGGDDDAPGAGDEARAAEAADPSTDKLAQVLARGTLVLSTDLRYPPQSFAVKKAERVPNSKCAPNQLTASEVDGYDAETAKLVAKALAVEACFVTPSWTEVTAGNWSDRWDVSWGSGAITAERMGRLWMTAPYRAEPQRFYVHEDSPAQRPGDLDGKRVGACASCSAEAYLKGELELPGVSLEQKIADPRIVTYDVDGPGLKALGRGKLDGFVCNENVGEQAIEDGVPIRALDEPAFDEFLTGFVDKSSGLEVGPFIERINAEIARLHADGSLRELSMTFFGDDFASEAAAFDLASIGQKVAS